MIAFSFRSSALLLPWLCAGLVFADLVDGAHASGPQQQNQLRAGNNRYLREGALLSDAPSLVPSQPPSDAPSIVPSTSPTAAPSDPPSDSPSNVPSLLSSSIPSDLPSAVPSPAPSAAPSDVPSTYPSDLPSAVPTSTPSTTSSNVPSDLPSAVPSNAPSTAPSAIPSDVPSITPSDVTSTYPSDPPSAVPSTVPSTTPSTTSSNVPSDLPSAVPSNAPSTTPSAIPSDVPSITPSDATSISPSGLPSAVPSDLPSTTPSKTSSSVPSDLPSAVPSNAPSTTPSAIPSDVPSTTPSDTPSTVPSHTPSVITSDGPSNVSSDVPSAVLSHVPSAAPSGVPSDVPSQVPSVAPSVAPSNSPNGEPSAAPSGAPSVILSGTPSDVPSLVPSPVPSASPTLVGSTFPSEFPSAKPSALPLLVRVEDSPTARPSGSRVPSGMPSNIPSTAPSFATEYVAVDTLNLVVSADTIMDTATIAIFEEECAAFLPVFLPSIYQTEFQFVECEVLSQSLVDVPGRRRLQQGEQDSRTLMVLVRTSARANLPSSIRFNNLVGQVFGTFGLTLQSNLNSALPYFGTTSTLVSGVEEGLTNTVTTGAEDKAKVFPIIPVVAAAVVGAVLAIGMAAFMLSVKRERGDDILPRHSTTISVESFIIDGDIDDGDHKTGTQLSESTTGPFLPPTPIGVRSVPDEIDSKSFAEPECGLSPDSISSAPRNSSKEVQYQYPESSSPDVLGLGQTGASFHRSKSERQGREMATASEPESSLDSTLLDNIMSKQGEYRGEEDPLGSGQSVSAVDRSLQAVKRKTPDEGKWDIDVLKLISSRSATAAAATAAAADDETLAAADEANDQFVVNPFPRRNFFGFALGFRNQNEVKDYITHETPAYSTDLSIDPMRAAGTPVDTAKNTSRHVTIEECKARSPQGHFLKKSEIPSGGEFLQMDVISAAHTGDVLDDLGKAEQEWKGQLNSVLSATAETPRVDNTQSANASGGEFIEMNVISAAHTGSVLDDLGKAEQDWKGQLNATLSATAETPKVGNTQSANTHRSRREIYSEANQEQLTSTNSI